MSPCHSVAQCLNLWAGKLLLGGRRSSLMILLPLYRHPTDNFKCLRTTIHPQFYYHVLLSVKIMS